MEDSYRVEQRGVQAGCGARERSTHTPVVRAPRRLSLLTRCRAHTVRTWCSCAGSAFSSRMSGRSSLSVHSSKKKWATLLELPWYELADEMVVVPTWPVEKPSTKLLQSFRSVATESFEVAVAIQQNQRTPPPIMPPRCRRSRVARKRGTQPTFHITPVPKRGRQKEHQPRQGDPRENQHLHRQFNTKMQSDQGNDGK